MGQFDRGNRALGHGDVRVEHSVESGFLDRIEIDRRPFQIGVLGLDQLDHIFQAGAGVPDHADLERKVVADMRFGNIQMQEGLGVRIAIKLPVIRRRAVGVGADKENGVRLEYVLVGIFHTAAATDDTQGKRMVFGNGAFARRGRANRNLQQFGKFQDDIGCL